jgi:type IV secretory pathway TrbF-like protein
MKLQERCIRFVSNVRTVVLDEQIVRKMDLSPFD